MHLFEYKNHVIFSSPRLQLWGSWSAQVLIKYGNNRKTFELEEGFSTKAEAVFYCIRHGKELIDNGIEFD